MWLQWHLGGGNPLIFHIVSALTHALAVVFVWRVLLRLSIPFAWFAAAVFAVHPVCVASVAWISEQKNTISIIFYLLTLLFYLRYEHEPRKITYASAIAMFACALLCKGSVVVLPFVLVLIIWWRNRNRRQTVRRYFPTIPFFILAVAGSFMVVFFQKHNSIGFAKIEHAAGLERVLAAAREIWFYAWKDLLPIKLNVIYPKWRIDSNDAMAYLPLLGLCVVVVLCWMFRKHGDGQLSSVSRFRRQPCACARVRRYVVSSVLPNR